MAATPIKLYWSRKGNCWDNAPVEWFFSSLKREWTGDRLYRTRQEAIADVREYVAMYYNSKRLHSTLGYKTPMNYKKTLNKVFEITWPLQMAGVGRQPKYTSLAQMSAFATFLPLR